jgi:hypothetical protein
VALIRITDAGRIALEAFRSRFLAAMRSDLERLPSEQLTALSSAAEALGSFVDVLQR